MSRLLYRRRWRLAYHIPAKGPIAPEDMLYFEPKLPLAVKEVRCVKPPNRKRIKRESGFDCGRPRFIRFILLLLRVTCEDVIFDA